MLEPGPGRFDPKDMGKIAGGVAVGPLERVGHGA